MLAVVSEGIQAGARALAPIAYQRREIEPRRSVGRTQRCRIWIRDHFRCRYCSGKVIPNSLLELLSDIYPDDFPYNLNWKGGITHPAFEARAAMADHVVPGSAGGAWLDDENLVTACNPCNSIKADFTLEQLGWELQPIANDDWDGLTKYYIRLWRAAGSPKPDYHRRWMRDLGVGEEEPNRVKPRHPAGSRVRRSDRSSTSPLPIGTPTQLVVGSFVRVCLPGKRSRRSYRVVRVDEGEVELQELWRGEQSRRWTAGRRAYVVRLDQLDRLETYPFPAPMPGDPV